MARTKKPQFSPTDISVVVGNVLGSVPTLPGESVEQYQLGLQALIQELEAKTVMQVYLAEKIFECIWWMRRYEQQKRMTLIHEMAIILNQYDKVVDIKELTMEELEKELKLEDLANLHSIKFLNKDKIPMTEIILNKENHKEFEALLSASEHTEHSLLQLAFNHASRSISDYNGQIAVLAKTLAGFQASYEVLTNRKLNTERLRLQNELLAKDLAAIEIKAQADAGQP